MKQKKRVVFVLSLQISAHGSDGTVGSWDTQITSETTCQSTDHSVTPWSEICLSPWPYKRSERPLVAVDGNPRFLEHLCPQIFVSSNQGLQNKVYKEMI